MRPSIVASAALLLTLASCGGVSRPEARALVEHYNHVVTQAYRGSDVNLIDSVVAAGSEDGKRLTGLIGVKRDLGVVLDATLLSLEVEDVDRDGPQLRVRTRERWRYLDRRIGSGEVAGSVSTDEYELLYTFRDVKGRWMVERTAFTAPPVVGNERAPAAIPVEAHTGLAPVPTAPAGGAER